MQKTQMTYSLCIPIGCSSFSGAAQDFGLRAPDRIFPFRYTGWDETTSDVDILNDALHICNESLKQAFG